MCGIAGWIDWRHPLEEQQEVLQAMADAMAARGPDDEGIWVSRHAGLAHRRLAIIDLQGGHQPMVVTLESGQRYVIIYSGEIYNFIELRQTLQARGHRFLTRSDTEVLLRSYIEWGNECVEKLNGIFAFGIWNDVEQELFLARDRLGVKPLFYVEEKGRLLFGSELKVLFAHPALQAEVDAEGLAELIALYPTRTPGHAIFKGVQELRPGHTLRFNRQGSRITQYWRLESHPHLDDEKTTIQNIRELLYDIVQRQMISDVPLCSLLSGGLDSSGVTAIAGDLLKKQESGTVQTFSVDYQDSETYFQATPVHPGRDAPWAKQVAQHVHTDHHEIIVDTMDLIRYFSQPLQARDLPSMGDIDTSLYLLFSKLRQYATVALSGESADEVFGGYPWFTSPAKQTFPWIPFAQSAGMKLEELLSPEWADQIRPHEYMERRYQEALAEVPYLPSEKEEDHSLREISYLTLTRWLPNLLERKDRMSMAVGLEVRVPFCDHRLIEYVWNVPWALKTMGGQEKGLLRQALSGLLPDGVLRRKKSAYPMSQHPAYAQAIQQKLRERIEDPSAPIRSLFDIQRIKMLLKKSQSDYASFNGATYLSAYIVQLNEWLRTYRVRIS